jgi:putative hydrolase of the HAD superfamily
MQPESTQAEFCWRVSPPVRAVLFDVYGTLFISGSGDIGILDKARSGEALRNALIDAGCSGDLDAAAALGGDLLMKHIRLSHAASRAQGIEYPEVEIRDIWAATMAEISGQININTSNMVLERLAVAYECRVNPVWPMPGYKALFEAVTASRRPMGIVSNAQCYTPLLFPALMNRTLDEPGFDADLCVWSYREGCAKPSTRLFRRVQEKLERKYGIAASETVYVGNDMLNDMFTAASTGMQTVLFAGDRRSLRWRTGDQRVTGIQPDAVITHLSQLADPLRHRSA